MTNPETEYGRLVSGDAAAIKSFAGELDAVLHVLNGIREDLAGAGELPCGPVTRHRPSHRGLSSPERRSSTTPW